MIACFVFPQAKQDIEDKVAKYDPNNDAMVEVRPVLAPCSFHAALCTL
jgi:hypothetical protein